MLTSLLLVITGMPLLLLLIAGLLSRIIGGFTHNATCLVDECAPHILFQITTRDCPAVVYRAIDSIRLACQHVGLNNIEIWVVTEHSNIKLLRYGNIRVVFVPLSFDCGAHHKARALEYARHIRVLEGYNGWIYFMDEENWLSIQTIHAILHCIDHCNCDMATGPVHYERSGAAMPWFADSIRDAQCRFCHICHSLGNWFAYGENLLVTSELERKVTWACDSLTEDAVFTGRAVSMGFRSSWHGGVLNSVSPMSVSDLILQRRRWYGGLVCACRERGFAPHIKITLVAILVSVYVVPVFACATFIVAPAMACCGLLSWYWSIYSALLLAWIYGSGCAGCARERIIAALLSGGSAVLESASAWWALMHPPSDFYIVAKDDGSRPLKSARPHRL